MNATEFLSQSEDVKTSYLVIMGAISSADRSNSPEEIAFMEQMASVAGLSADSQAQVAEALKNTASVNLASHIEKFKNHELRFALISDLLSLAYKDGSLGADETTQIKQIGGVLGINDEQYDALNKYVTAANSEAAKTAGNPLMDANGQPKEPSNDFLERIGLKGVFDKLGIPIGNFINGTTITMALSTVAIFVIQNYMNSGKQGTAQATNQANPWGAALTGVLGSFMAGGAATSQQTAANGLQGMVSSFFTSQAGQATMSTLVNSFMKSNSQGQGLAGSLMGILGGGATPQQNGGAQMLQNVLGMFMKK
jgi:uncharacterized tellurite resistance protein B-like protein